MTPQDHMQMQIIQKRLKFLETLIRFWIAFLIFAVLVNLAVYAGAVPNWIWTISVMVCASALLAYMTRPVE